MRRVACHTAYHAVNPGAPADSAACCVPGIENIGVQIEQPFAVLPVSSISNTIKANLLHMLANADLTRRLALQELPIRGPLNHVASHG